MKYIPKTFHDFSFNEHFGIMNHDKTLVTYHLCNTLFCTHCHSILNEKYDLTISENVNSPGVDVHIYKMIMAHNVGAMSCPNCANRSALVPVDSVIAPAIREFNERGWKTSECCSGHPYVDDDGKVYCSPTFIKFSIEQPSNTSLKEEIDELVSINEKPYIKMDGFHIFLLADKKGCDVVPTEYKLCIYINDRLPETYISMAHPSPVCNWTKFNEHMYSYLRIGNKWDRKSSYKRAVDTIEKRCLDLLSIAVNVSNRIHE